MNTVSISIEDCRLAAGILFGTVQAWSNLALWHKERGHMDDYENCEKTARMILDVHDRLWIASSGLKERSKRDS